MKNHKIIEQLTHFFMIDNLIFEKESCSNNIILAPNEERKAKERLILSQS